MVNASSTAGTRKKTLHIRFSLGVISIQHSANISPVVWAVKLRQCLDYPSARVLATLAAAIGAGDAACPETALTTEDTEVHRARAGCRRLALTLQSIHAGIRRKARG